MYQTLNWWGKFLWQIGIYPNDPNNKSNLVLYLIGLLVVVFLLFYYGFLGPKRLRIKMRKAAFDSAKKLDENYGIFPPDTINSLFYKPIKISWKPFRIKFFDTKNQYDPIPLEDKIKNQFSIKYFPLPVDKYALMFFIFIVIVVIVFIWSLIK